MASKPIGKTLDDFRAAHDKNVIVPARIRKALAEMEKEGGAENWDYEQQFMKRAGVCTTDLALFREQFQDHIVETTGRNAKRVWVASAKAAAKFRI